MEKLNTLRAVINKSEREFGTVLSKVLSPAQPLQSEEYLKGRAKQLHGIERAIHAPGRHILIHGLRGVGKSSLAQTAAFKIARGNDPIIVSCDNESTFKSIIKNIFDEAIGLDPRIAEKIENVEASGNLALPFLSFLMKGSTSQVQKEVPEPLSINDTIRILSFLTGEMEGTPVFVIDEFDLITDKNTQRDFANLIKQVSDKRVNAKFIFCGIAESADALMAAHASADRYFHAVDLEKLPWDARIEIVKTAADTLGIEINETTVYRIAMISDGFPYYAHFLSEKLFWRVFEANNGGVATPELFDLAISDAASAMDMKLRGPYEKATQKYEDTYSAILFAVADGHELKKRSTDIFNVYVRIMADLKSDPLDRNQFNNRMNSLKKASHACILSGSRAGWYEFTEKMIRGYIKLKAEQMNVSLNPDHPEAPRSLRR